MRVSSINIAQPRSLNYEMKMRHAELPQTQVSQTAFKGLKGGFFSLLGATVGGAVGIALTGGVLAPFLLASAGAVVGGDYGNKDEPKSDEYGVPYDGPSGFDYIG